MFDNYRMHELVSMLGLETMRVTGLDLARNIDPDPLKELTPLIWEHKNCRRIVRQDVRLTSRVEDVFGRYGPLLWPDEAEDRIYVVNATLDDRNGLYPRDLYYTNLDDRKK